MEEYRRGRDWYLLYSFRESRTPLKIYGQEVMRADMHICKYDQEGDFLCIGSGGHPLGI